MQIVAELTNRLFKKANSTFPSRYKIAAKNRNEMQTFHLLNKLFLRFKTYKRSAHRFMQLQIRY